MSKSVLNSVKEFARWLEDNDIGIEKIYMYTHGQPPLEMSATLYTMALDTKHDRIELRGVDAIFTVSQIRAITITKDKRYATIGVTVECDLYDNTYSFELKLL